MASQHKQVLPARLRLLRILAFFLVAFLCGWNLYHRSLFARRGNRTMVDLPYGLWSEKQPGISTLGPGEISWYPCVPASKNVECGSILCEFVCIVRLVYYLRTVQGPKKLFKSLRRNRGYCFGHIPRKTTAGPTKRLCVPQPRWTWSARNPSHPQYRTELCQVNWR
ncbi:hypothetical protein GYMLUDRAFT_468865 [Collybiopsis luxurians FD-317 M1]|uniref:Uncharacterized protein n=1 Tax=Collybiopsis luxurians FD-317 M1 TaxID=944289 RepID=A0A0D0C602_9AGAR|nr:hypothetical protein GYMLUDRAFT_468865 [Collybiopsis luxurians FD-317 M1]